ncbi:MAG TPA: hypothetical protein VGO70_04240 [Arsenicitalea sp.]|nr:hypothetical protein [Arsenicitalea sp.]
MLFLILAAAGPVFAAQRPIVNDVQLGSFVVRVSVKIQSGRPAVTCSKAQRKELTEKSIRMLALSGPFMVSDYISTHPRGARAGKVLELKLAASCYEGGGLDIAGAEQNSPYRFQHFEPNSGWQTAG